MSVTSRAEIQGALKLIGVLDPAETMAPEDADDGLLWLNNMVDAWNVERLYIYTISEVVATFAGASATIGPGLQINTARPVRIESAFYRLGGIDFPIRQIDYAEYDAIALKNTGGSYPEVFYYTGDSPTGTVYVWPIPASNEYHFQVQTQLTAFEDLDTLHTLPQGYAKALMYSLAIELAPLYQREASATVMRVAMNSVRALKRANVVVPTLEVNGPCNSQNRHTGRINILTGM